MSEHQTSLRVVVAAPLAPDLCDLVQQLEPRIDLVVDQALLPPMRHPADFAGDPAFRRSQEEQARFHSLVDTADALYGIPDVDPAALARTVAANPRLRWVQTMAAGGGSQVRAAQLAPADLRRVTFTTSAGVHGEPLAEYALFGVLAGAKTLPRLRRQQDAREWSDRWMMRQVSDQRVLVLGLGGIGKRVARKLTGLGATVIGVAKSVSEHPDVAEVVAPEDVPRVLGTIDAVVNTLPGTDSTHHFIDTTFLNALPTGATIVSLGRGTVVDERALLAALDSGKVGFAALDVFEMEPLPQTSPLWDHPNVLVSPHTAALTPGEDRLIAELFAANAGRLLDGTPLVNIVDTVDFY